MGELRLKDFMDFRMSMRWVRDERQRVVGRREEEERLGSEDLRWER